MFGKMTRRRFPAALAGLAIGGPAVAGSLLTDLARAADGPSDGDSLTFPVLGDLHFDRLEHHDLDWLRRDHPGDVHQVENYSKLTREILPGSSTSCVRSPTGRDEPPALRDPGGRPRRGPLRRRRPARTQCAEAIDLVRRAAPGSRSCSPRGTTTSPGRARPRRSTASSCRSWASRRARTCARASYTVERGGACSSSSTPTTRRCLDWLERTLAGRSARHLFVVVHPPVVPFGARSLWHLFANPKQEPQRKRLLNVLGEHRAIVLCGHLHKFGVVVRSTERGPFLQLALSSIIPKPDVAATQPRVGSPPTVPTSSGSSPRFSPETEPAPPRGAAGRGPLDPELRVRRRPGLRLDRRPGRSRRGEPGAWPGPTDLEDDRPDGPARLILACRGWIACEVARNPSTSPRRFLPLRHCRGRDITRPPGSGAGKDAAANANVGGGHDGPGSRRSQAGGHRDRDSLGPARDARPGAGGRGIRGSTITPTWRRRIAWNGGRPSGTSAARGRGARLPLRRQPGQGRGRAPGARRAAEEADLQLRASAGQPVASYFLLRRVLDAAPGRRRSWSIASGPPWPAATCSTRTCSPTSSARSRSSTSPGRSAIRGSSGA